MTVCKICGNTKGFGFGTCCNCGYNYLDNTFHFIQVRVDDLLYLPLEIKENLINKHQQKFNNK